MNLTGNTDNNTGIKKYSGLCYISSNSLSNNVLGWNKMGTNQEHHGIIINPKDVGGTDHATCPKRYMSKLRYEGWIVVFHGAQMYFEWSCHKRIYIWYMQLWTVNKWQTTEIPITTFLSFRLHICYSKNSHSGDLSEEHLMGWSLSTSCISPIGVCNLNDNGSLLHSNKDRGLTVGIHCCTWYKISQTEQNVVQE